MKMTSLASAARAQEQRGLILMIVCFTALLIELLAPSSYGLSNERRAITREVNLHHLPKDKSGQYLIFQYAIRSPMSPSSSSVHKLLVNATLASHLTPQHLHELFFAMSRWGGYGSVSIFLSDVSSFHTACSLLEEYGRCFPDLLAAIDFHFVFLSNISVYAGDALSKRGSANGHGNAQQAHNGAPGSDDRNPDDVGPPHWVLQWTDPFSLLPPNSKIRAPCPTLGVKNGIHEDSVKNGATSLEDARVEEPANYAQSVLYPNNMLRNVAIAAARTDVVIMLDADMVPSRSLASNVAELLAVAGRTEKIALVAPGD